MERLFTLIIKIAVQLTMAWFQLVIACLKMLFKTLVVLWSQRPQKISGGPPDGSPDFRRRRTSRQHQSGSKSRRGR